MFSRARFGFSLAVVGGAATYASAASASPPLRDTPQACTAVTQEELRRSGSVSVADVLKAVPKAGTPSSCPQRPLKPFDRFILDGHNAERASLGIPPLHWNEALAVRATNYAEELARLGQLVHSPREGRGIERENLARGLIGWSGSQMIDEWVKEKSNFVPGIFPNVARDGNWMAVAHYTQMIWPTTTDLGCGSAQGLGFNWLVCRYSPGGNKDGKPVGLPLPPPPPPPAPPPP